MAKTFDGRAKGAMAVSIALNKVKDRAVKAAEESLEDGLFAIHETAVTSLQKQTGGGPVYRRRGRVHKASKPGDPPNSDTGRLAQSVDVEINKSQLTGRVGTNVKYGAFHEFGTRTLPPRPWLRPAAQKNKSKIGKIFKATVESSVKKTGKE